MSWCSPCRRDSGAFSLSLAAAAVLMMADGAAARPVPSPFGAGRAVEVTTGPAGAPGASGSTAAASPAKGLARISAEEIEQASYDGGDLPPGQSALTAKVQILLDRSGISPGVVDGWRGGMSESAIRAFQRRAGLPITGRMDHAVWDLLQGYAAEPVTGDYTITAEDATGLVDRIPTDYAEKAQMSSQGYTSVLEKLAERFHMDEKFLAKLNAGRQFVPGTTIKVTVPAKPIRARVTRIIIDKETRRVAAYDASGHLVADYPATVGSSDTPSPHGTHTVAAVALNPTYTYNPKRNFKQGNNDKVLIVPPGPNGPVGTVWIDLSKPTYGIHGTPTPSQLFVNQSHGCVRLTNWDAWELAHMVKPGETQVEFLPPGVRIADVIGHTAQTAVSKVAAATTISGIRPPARGDRQPRWQDNGVTATAPAPGLASTAAAAIAGTLPAAAASAPYPASAGPDDAGLKGTAAPAAGPGQDSVDTLPDSIPGQQPGSVSVFPPAQDMN
ncbi:MULTISPECIES: L,D-transpeptidase family protein [unclassified Paracoccus (in: a-proteobacteria)]|uniref:L,D-transpeptidase family protein n=1 Tax=unclassified Paracoccus (in: a-proteobacteria) TaxID=2688777 RepID=UPI0018A6AB27|nr:MULTISPECIES: L,D-transpeptidase [unclassified Paracoccus (in: a-proteobacteria)]UXU75101.1 L,D-transpeptidase [Paracoccus sp. SMMA_5]UXU81004.1 L,D-transpeptidase [Paracoccus sp. SMMA_5_TC]